jgi:hypothetical protein
MIRPLEDYWAYPVPRLMQTVGEAITERNPRVFTRLVQKISAALLTGTYRHEGAAWDPLQEGEGRALDVLPPDVMPGETQKPYFEVLVVTRSDLSTWERARGDLKRLRRPEDSFHYERVQVGSFEDGAIGTIFNHNIQAVVLYDGFQFNSRHDLAVLRDFLLRSSGVDPSNIAPGALATTLARLIKCYRPELDIYLLTDRAVPNFSRFHDVFRDNPQAASNEGHMRPAFFMAYDESNCELVPLARPQIDERLKSLPSWSRQTSSFRTRRDSPSWCPAR